MRVAKLYDLLAPVYGRVMDPLDGVAVIRAVHRVRAGDPQSLLEVGVGPGRLLQELGSEAGTRVVGVDISSGMLSVARRATAELPQRPRLARADALRLPFPTGAFEAVVSTYLLDLLAEEDVPKALAEMTRVAAPGGRLIVGVMELSRPAARQAWMLAYRTVPELVGRCRPLDLSGILPPPGLRVVTEESVTAGIGMRLFTMVKVGLEKRQKPRT